MRREFQKGNFSEVEQEITHKVHCDSINFMQCEILIFIGVRRGMLKTKKSCWDSGTEAISSLYSKTMHDSKIKVIVYTTNYGVVKSTFFTIACSSYTSQPIH